MKKHVERVYQLSNYDSICPEERKRVLAPYIVADTLLAVNRLLLAQGIGLQITMHESSDGDDMYCAVDN
jgi:hypothetical protein